jgi:undecaprenyl-diphosphatase
MLPSEPGSAGVLHSLVLGVVEGITEFLPISSTGHLIVANALLGRSDPSFEVAIQAGAITAILALYWRQLLRALLDLRARAASAGRNLLVLIAVAAIPATAVGLSFEDAIEARLFNPLTVAVTLVLGGFGLLALEWYLEQRERAGRPRSSDLSALSLSQALVIGCWQVLALIPGTSRAGATIAGGLMTGLSRSAAAEFSFLVGLPILYGACVLKVGQDFARLSGPLLPELLLAAAAAFVSALLVVGPFVRFLQRHSFRPFAWYRVVAGAAIFGLHGAGLL